MRKSFKQVSTGLTLVCEREDVIKQYEKYPDLYIPLENEPEKKVETPKAKTETEKPAEAEAKTEPAAKADTPKTPEKK